MHFPDAQGFSGITARPDLARDAATLAPVVGSAPPKISLGTGLHGRLNVKAFKWIIGTFPIHFKTKSPEFSADIDLAARIDGWISPGLNPDWSLSHQEHFDVHVLRASGSTLWGIIHFDARDRLQKGVDDAAPGMIKAALDTLAAQLHIRTEVEKVWKKLYEPVKIAEQPSAFALLRPEGVRLQKIAFDDPNTWTVRLALDGKCLTEIAGNPPTPSPPNQLPPLVQQSALNPVFHVAVPLAFNLSEVNKAIKARWHQVSVKLDDNSTVEIRDISFDAHGGFLYAKSSIRGENRLIRAVVDGEIFVHGRPVYDQSSQQIRIEAVGFELKTKSLLQNLAAWLLNDLICKEIEKSLVLNVSEQTAKLKRDANSRLTAVAVAPGIQLTPKLETLTLTGIQASDGLLVAGFDLSGELSCDISANAFHP